MTKNAMIKVSSLIIICTILSGCATFNKANSNESPTVHLEATSEITIFPDITPTPNLTNTPAPTPAPTPRPTISYDMGHVENIDIIIKAAELFCHNEFRGMESPEYNDFLNMFSGNVLENYSGVGRVSDDISYVVLSRKEGATEEFSKLLLHNIKQKENVYLKAHYLKPLDVVVVIQYRYKLNSEKDLVSKGIRSYVSSLLYDDAPSIEKLYELKCNGVRFEQDGLSIQVRNLRHYYTMYINDFDFNTFFELLEKQKSTKEKVECDLEDVPWVNIRIHGIKGEAEFALDKNGNKLVNGYFNDELFDMVADVVMEKTDWYYMSINEIKDIKKARLYVDGERLSTITDEESLKKLEKLIHNSIPNNNFYLGGRAGKIKLNLKNGKRVVLLLDGECDTFTVGAGSTYDYSGKEDRDDTNRLGRIFGVNDLSSKIADMWDKLDDKYDEFQNSIEEINLFVNSRSNSYVKSFFNDFFIEYCNAIYKTYEIPTMDMIEDNENKNIFIQWIKNKIKTHKESDEFELVLSNDINVGFEKIEENMETVKYYVWADFCLEDRNVSLNNEYLRDRFDILLRKENDGYKIIKIDYK